MTQRERINAMRKRIPYGKDVLAAAGVLAHDSPETRRNTMDMGKAVDIAETAYGDMSRLCPAAKRLAERYKMPFALTVAGLYSGTGEDADKAIAFAKAVLAGQKSMVPCGWPQTLAEWLQANQAERQDQWNRTCLYRALRSATHAYTCGLLVTGLDGEGGILKQEEPDEQVLDAEAHVKSCIDRCAALMTELYDVLKQISGAVPETASGKSCVSR